jgi:N-acyl-D-amino-acid deacylase
VIDYLLSGGTVVDGSAGPPVALNVGIRDARIVYVGSQAAEARQIIDARGLTVSPGFIDTHTHSEFTLLADGRAEGRVCQGVTTEINGNCGLSAAPLLGEAREHREESLRELGIQERWSSFSEYFALLEARGISINCATLCGHGNLRASVIGYRDRTADAEERSRMKVLLNQALSEGARGLSTGLIYPPGVFSRTDELVELARVLPRQDARGLYASHMRSEGDGLLDAIDEVLTIAREGSVRAHISHLKTAGEKNWHRIDRAIGMIQEARHKGMGLTCDRYPYIASSSDLDSLLPAWLFDGGTDEELRRLKDPSQRRRIAAEIGHRDERHWQGVVVSSVTRPENKWMEGKSLAMIAAELMRPAVDALLDILIAERSRAGAIFFTMNEDNLRRILSLPFTMIGSDSSVRSSSGVTMTGKPHPRGFGTFPRFLGKYVREEGLVTLPEAVRKMTALPAATFGLHDRGLIKEGFFADLTVFDSGRVSDRATFEDPFLAPVGITHVFVNGAMTVRDGSYLGTRKGTVLR